MIFIEMKPCAELEGGVPHPPLDGSYIDEGNFKYLRHTSDEERELIRRALGR